jgi:hypothetical protein
VNGRDTLTLTGLDKLEEPPSLLTLRDHVLALLPRIDLPELLLEMHARVVFQTWIWMETMPCISKPSRSSSPHLKHYRQIHAPDIQQEPAVKIQICNTTERSLLAGGLGEERFDLRQ